jgi:hypothetical protein
MLGNHIMKFQSYDLGYHSGGDVVVITLVGSSVNVRLMDSSNFNSYKNGRRHTYYGGLARRSPVRITIPHSGHWYVTIDFQGLRGSVRSSVRVESPEPGPLPPIEQRPLASIPSLVRHPEINSNLSADPAAREFDVFISHASEDKDEVVRPLATALQAGDLDVWYDEFELKIGDSLRRKIDSGVSRSRFGIVVLSQDFFRKGWTNYELDGLVTRSVSGEQILLPIWHNITKKEVIQYSPSLADKLARSTSTHTVEEIAAEIIEVIKEASNSD